MTSKLMLDTGVIARLCHPTQFRQARDWLRSLLDRGADAPEILVSVLADYELRRKLLDLDAKESLLHLDELARSVRYVPLTAEAGRRAAELRHALGTAVVSSLSDADLLMVAQAHIEGAVLVTNDRAVLGIPGIMVQDWSEIDRG